MSVNIRKLATVMAGGNLVGSQNMGGASYGGASHGPPAPGPSSVQAGAASIPGKSIHCLSCGAKLKSGVPACPKCGSDVQRVAASDSGLGASEDTGGQAAVRDGQSEEDEDGEEKHASSRTLGAASEIARNIAGGASIVGGLELARRVTMPMKKKLDQANRADEYLTPSQQYTSARKGQEALRSAIRKAASARPCNPVLNLRRGSPSTVKDGLADADRRVARLKETLARKGY